MATTASLAAIAPAPSAAESVYQQSIALVDRLHAVSGFAPYLDAAALAVGRHLSKEPHNLPVPVPMSEAAAAVVVSVVPSASQGALPDVMRADPVALLWTALRLGEPLAFLFNLAVPQAPITLATAKAARSADPAVPVPEKLTEALPSINAMKALVYHFIVGVRAHQATLLINPETDCFSITELYADDTSGFVRVLRTLRMMLDRLEAFGKIAPLASPAPASAGAGAALIRRRSESASRFQSARNSDSESPSMQEAVARANANFNASRNRVSSNATDSADEQSDLSSNVGKKSRPATQMSGLSTLTHRQRVLVEMLQTERKYVADLERMQSYMQHLSSTEVVPLAVISSIFSNLNALVDFQRRFLIGLETILDAAESGQERVGALFVGMESSFSSIYGTFCSNYKVASETALEHSAALQTVVNTAPPQVASVVMEPNYELPSYLIKPIQRICRYPLLLGELIKAIKKRSQSASGDTTSDPDLALLPDLQQGLDSIKRVVDQVNEARRKQENQQVKNDLERRVADWKGHDIHSFGDLLLHDKFVMMIQDYERELVIFLFEKIILCCKEVIRETKSSSSTFSNPATLLKRRTKSSTSLGGSFLSGGSEGSASSPSLAGATSSLVNLPAGIKPDSVSYQIKGRIWIGGVTDLRGGENAMGTFLLTVCWTSLTKVEFFTLKCRNEEQYRQWMGSIQKCVEVARERGRLRAAQKAARQQQQVQQQNQSGENPRSPSYSARMSSSTNASSSFRDTQFSMATTASSHRDTQYSMGVSEEGNLDNDMAMSQRNTYQQPPYDMMRRSRSAYEFASPPPSIPERSSSSPYARAQQANMVVSPARYTQYTATDNPAAERDRSEQHAALAAYERGNRRSAPAPAAGSQGAEARPPRSRSRSRGPGEREPLPEKSSSPDPPSQKLQRHPRHVNASRAPPNLAAAIPGPPLPPPNLALPPVPGAAPKAPLPPPPGAMVSSKSMPSIPPPSTPPPPPLSTQQQPTNSRAQQSSDDPKPNRRRSSLSSPAHAAAAAQAAAKFAAAQTSLGDTFSTTAAPPPPVPTVSEAFVASPPRKNSATQPATQLRLPSNIADGKQGMTRQGSSYVTAPSSPAMERLFPASSQKLRDSPSSSFAAKPALAPSSTKSEPVPAPNPPSPIPPPRRRPSLTNILKEAKELEQLVAGEVSDNEDKEDDLIAPSELDFDDDDDDAQDARSDAAEDDQSYDPSVDYAYEDAKTEQPSNDDQPQSISSMLDSVRKSLELIESSLPQVNESTTASRNSQSSIQNSVVSRASNQTVTKNNFSVASKDEKSSTVSESSTSSLTPSAPPDSSNPLLVGKHPASTLRDRSSSSPPRSPLQTGQTNITSSSSGNPILINRPRTSSSSSAASPRSSPLTSRIPPPSLSNSGSPTIDVMKCEVKCAADPSLKSSIFLSRGITFSSLASQVKRKLNRSDTNFRITYLDANGETVNITSDDDVSNALNVALTRTASGGASVMSGPAGLTILVHDI